MTVLTKFSMVLDMGDWEHTPKEMCSLCIVCIECCLVVFKRQKVIWGVKIRLLLFLPSALCSVTHKVSISGQWLWELSCGCWGNVSETVLWRISKNYYSFFCAVRCHTIFVLWGQSPRACLLGRYLKFILRFRCEGSSGPWAMFYLCVCGESSILFS